MVQRSRLVQFEKWLIWGTLMGVIALLHHLFPIFFLTFVISYIGNTAVKAMSKRYPRRRVNVVVFYLLLITGIAGLAVLIIPRMYFEARQFAKAYLEQGVEEPAEEGIEPLVTETLTSQPVPVQTADSVIDRETKKYLDTLMVQILGRDSFDSFSQSESYRQLVAKTEKALASVVPEVVKRVKRFVNGSIIIALHFLLSIILSFLVLWDLPSLSAGASGLASGRTAEIYAEIAPGLRAFGVILGRAFEAQTLIAIANTVLTSIGFVIIGVPSISLLAPIVFFCSFVPVFGVFLSSIPAALLAFKVGGPGLLVWLIVMILVVHTIEAYLLNPVIYGRELKLHPVVVLVILVIAEHLIGVWGLILAVPLMAFFVQYVIRGQVMETGISKPVEAVAASEEA